MRKIILFIHTTFNGVVTGDPSKGKPSDIDWPTDASQQTGSEYLLKIMDTVDTILLGRVTNEILSSAWPSMNDSLLGMKINNAHKLVVTDTLSPDELAWGKFEAPKQLSDNNIEDQIKDLKNDEGGDIIIFGSPTLVRSLLEADLIDEYHFQVHPVVVNVGEHLFDTLKERKDFDLLGLKPLEDGSIIVKYQLTKK